MRVCWRALTSTGGPAQASAVIKSRSTLSSPGPTGPQVRPAPGTLARLISLGRPAIMGVVNVTPDSFSDGGRFLDPQRAIEHARRLAVDGADTLDIGAESTRPYGGMVAVSREE